MSEIESVRGATDEELEILGWDHVPDRHRPAVIETTDGGVFIPSRDEEGNGPGALFEIANGESFLHVPDSDQE